MHPSRETALVATPTIPPRRRPLGGAWIAGLTAAMAAVGLATGGPLTLALVTLCACRRWASSSTRRAAWSPPT